MKQPFKAIFPYLIIGILIVIISFIQKCESEPIKTSEQTWLINQQSAKIHRLLLEVSTQKTDTLIVIKNRIKTKYDTTFIEIVKEAPDTCGYYLTKLDSECKRLDSANTNIINEQESQLIKYREIVGLMQERNEMQEKRHVTDSTTIQTLDKKLKRTRKLAAVGIGAAFIGGLIIK